MAIHLSQVKKLEQLTKTDEMFSKEQRERYPDLFKDAQTITDSHLIAVTHIYAQPQTYDGYYVNPHDRVWVMCLKFNWPTILKIGWKQRIVKDLDPEKIRYTFFVKDNITGKESWIV